MKKHRLMLPILAVIAGVAASAFTVKTPNDHLSRTDDPEYYWFTVSSIDGMGNITPGSYDDLNGQSPESKGEALNDNAQGCQDESETLCLIGYETSQVNINGSSVSVKSDSQNPSGFVQPLAGDGTKITRSDE